jgi:acetolactate synthase I/III small subunit
VKVSILGPEYLEDQLHGGLSHEPCREPDTLGEHEHEHHSKLDREMALAENFEHSATSSTPEQFHHNNHRPRQITPSEALRLRHQHLHSISVLASQFGAKLVDVSENSVIVEMSGKTSRVEAFLSLVKPFGVLESARTGDFFLSFGRGHFLIS